MNTIKLISLNIEGSKHLDLVIPFLQKSEADIICLQEVLEKDVAQLTMNIRGTSHYTRMSIDTDKNPLERDFGLLIITKDAHKLRGEHIYLNTEKQEFENIIENGYVNRILSVVEISTGGERFTIGTTHFTWSRDGEADNTQRRDWDNLYAQLQKYPEIVFCGDFNMPRGKEMFSQITKHYTDNIPQEVQTTLDPALHRVRGLMYVVDGLFSTPGYAVSDVEVISGVSDHCALIGTIQRTDEKRKTQPTH